MCDRFSIIVRRDGAIYHDPSNSHSGMVERAGWTENGVNASLRGKAAFIEMEWNGVGAMPTWGDEKFTRLNGGDYTKAQQDAGETFYRRLKSYLDGEDTYADYFNDPLYLDVKLKRAMGIKGALRMEVDATGAATYVGIYNCPALTEVPAFPAATYVRIYNCPALTGVPAFPAATDVRIDNCPGLKNPRMKRTSK